MREAQPIIHDGCHISNYRDFFEWWYFDFDLTSGHHVYIEWHAPNFTLRDAFCILVIRLLKDDKTCLNNQESHFKLPVMRTFRYHRSLVTQSTTSCHIVFPSGSIVETDGDYSIDVDEIDLTIRLRLQRLLPPFSPNDEILYRVGGSNEIFSWNVPLPRASVSGYINLNSVSIQVDGIAYHDHNWGNLNIGKHFLGWTWARVLFADFTLIFGDITPRDCVDKVQVAFLIDETGKEISTSSFRIDYDFLKSQNRYGLALPQNIVITFQHPRKFIAHLKVKQTYSRQEFPLGSSDNHLWNSILAKLYYLFRLNNAPSLLRKWFGRGIYFQSCVKGKLYTDNVVLDAANGKLEVFSFGV